ncbi:hypothetical protein C8F01DRAFT_1088525 [Mycena amicta]|nr:hypothetical protein C8F01DRAFT_1088525 [Mycena amicta]
MPRAATSWTSDELGIVSGQTRRAPHCPPTDQPGGRDNTVVGRRVGFDDDGLVFADLPTAAAGLETLSLELLVAPGATVTVEHLRESEWRVALRREDTGQRLGRGRGLEGKGLGRGKVGMPAVWTLGIDTCRRDNLVCERAVGGGFKEGAAANGREVLSGALVGGGRREATNVDQMRKEVSLLIHQARNITHVLMRGLREISTFLGAVNWSPVFTVVNGTGSYAKATGTSLILMRQTHRWETCKEERGAISNYTDYVPGLPATLFLFFPDAWPSYLSFCVLKLKDGDAVMSRSLQGSRKPEDDIIQVWVVGKDIITRDMVELFAAATQALPSTISGSATIDSANPDSAANVPELEDVSDDEDESEEQGHTGGKCLFTIVENKMQRK